VGIRVASALVLLAVALAGCATVYREDELEKRLERIAAATAGLHRPRTAPIHADTRVEALGLLAEARANADSPLSAAVGRRLAAAHRSRRDVVAGGPFADLTDRVLRNALSLQPDAGLRGLKLVVASQAEPSGELRSAARRTGVHLLYRSFR
jgi:hypothetical protein